MSLTKTHYNAKNITILNRFVKNLTDIILVDFFEDLQTLETKPVITQQTSITTRVPPHQKVVLVLKLVQLKQSTFKNKYW